MKPFVYNSKGSAKRDIVLAAYEGEINSLYNSTTTEVSRKDIPGTWNLSPTLDFIRQSVQTIMGVECMSDDDDFFDKGCDR